MNEKNARVTLISVFLPVYLAIARLIIHFEIFDLLYLVVIFMFVVRYYITKGKD